MMVEISKVEFPRYKGLRELIPGHLYRDNKGEEILFLGRGTYSRETIGDPNGYWGCRENYFLYMKWADVQKKIGDGRLSADLKEFAINVPSRADFWRTVYFSENPRILMEDLGEKYPDTYFLRLDILDGTELPDKKYWRIRT